MREAPAFLLMTLIAAGFQPGIHVCDLRFLRLAAPRRGNRGRARIVEEGQRLCVEGILWAKLGARSENPPLSSGLRC
ncbi:hypothetical protein AM571_CH00878 [Rhizobium etli 8C-3]|uniref:Uncharacterized protein n=1 Tax=Rhizobium etli 8C-3 TaxID=538025 RepID=A0A1L5P0T9_RHIET|nr:hypothetical protein AM571_CH00878 [Rhizobium etli 8C-3]